MLIEIKFKYEKHSNIYLISQIYSIKTNDPKIVLSFKYR